MEEAFAFGVATNLASNVVSELLQAGSSFLDEKALGDSQKRTLERVLRDVTAAASTGNGGQGERA